jgi:hypothetical protein
MTKLILAGFTALALFVGLVPSATAQVPETRGLFDPAPKQKKQQKKQPAKQEKKQEKKQLNAPVEDLEPSKDKNDYVQPEKKDNYVPEKKNTYVPEKKNNYVPQKKNNYVPEKKNSYIPDKKYNDYPEKNYKYKKVTYYKTVTSYVTKTEQYVKYYTVYDCCGYPQQYSKVCYRDVQVPVYKKVPYYKWVKVYYKNDYKGTY